MISLKKSNFSKDMIFLRSVKFPTALTWQCSDQFPALVDEGRQVKLTYCLQSRPVGERPAGIVGIAFHLKPAPISLLGHNMTI